MIALGVDVGGTFTDLVLADLAHGNVTIHKTPSTPANPSLGVVTGVQGICELAGIAPGMKMSGGSRLSRRRSAVSGLQ